MSSTGNMLGTVAYIAPEIATTAEADARSDIYSVGIMLYEMLTGSVPWAGESPLQIATHHVSDDVPSPSEAHPWIPREIDDLVAALTARDPASRPADASDAIDLVARAAATIPSELASRRAEIAPSDRADSSQISALNTEVISAQFTRPLPLPAPSTLATVHTSSPLPEASENTSTNTYKRAALWVSLVVLLLAAAGIGGSWWWTEYGPGSYLTMPATDGRPLAEVQAELNAMGLASTVEEEFSDDVASGSITRSDPEGGEPVHKRAEVQLYVSKGVDMKNVPDVAGKSQDDAKKALTEAGLALGAITDAYSEDVPQGQVISQSVASGTSVPHDTAVDVVLSKGREPLTVPSLGGMTADAAKTAIEALGLVATPTEAFSDTVAEGQIISQQTNEGTILHRGDTVAYTVSKGPEKVAVPDVVGRQRQEARTILENAGFTVQEEAILGGFFGTVRQTDPAGGTMLKKGSVVTITIV